MQTLSTTTINSDISISRGGGRSGVPTFAAHPKSPSQGVLCVGLVDNHSSLPPPALSTRVRTHRCPLRGSLDVRPCYRPALPHLRRFLHRQAVATVGLAIAAVAVVLSE